MGDAPQVVTGTPVGTAGSTQADGKCCRCCGEKTPQYVIRIFTACCSLACGLFCCNQMMYYDGDGKLRWHLIYFYLTVLALIVLAAEANLMRHRVFKVFASFVTNNTGRGITMLFMGGLILLHETAGLILGICMFVAGLMNLCGWCFFPDIKKQDEAVQQAQLAEQQQIAESRQRI